MQGAQAAINAKPHSFLQHVAKAGEAGDDQIGHLSTGDTIIPVEKTRNNPQAQQMLHQVFQALKLDPKRFVVGHRENRTNHRTGLRQFEGTGAGDSGEGPGAAGDTGASGPGTGTGDTGTGVGGVGSAGGSVGNAASPDNPNTNQGPPASVGQIDAGIRGNEQADLGLSSITSGNLGGFGQPDLGPLNGMINGLVNNPVTSALNLGFGLIPGAQIPAAINSISGMLGGPTVGSIATSLGRDASTALGGTSTAAPGSTNGPGTVTGSGGTVGSGGGSDIPVDQAAQDAEWLKRLGLSA